MFYFLIMLVLLLISIYLDHYIFDYINRYFIEKEVYQIEKILEDFHSESWQLKRLKSCRNILFLLLLWPIVSFDFMYIVVIVALCVFVYKMKFLKIKQKKEAAVKQIHFQFPIWLRQIQVLLQNNTVVKAIDLSIVHAPQLMKKDLILLSEDVKNKPIEMSSYTNFLQQYELLEIQRAMKLIYRYNTIGKEDSYHQLNRMIQTTTKWLRSIRQESKKTELLAFQWWGIFPLFGVTIVFLMIMTSIITSFFGEGVSL